MDQDEREVNCRQDSSIGIAFNIHDPGATKEFLSTVSQFSINAAGKKGLCKKCNYDCPLKPFIKKD